MCRMVRDSVEISGAKSLDQLIDELVTLREQLPAGAEPEVKLQGNDAFGRRLSVRYMRPQTDEEAACEARYAGAVHRPREFDHHHVDDGHVMICPLPRGNPGLRIVA